MTSAGRWWRSADALGTGVPLTRRSRPLAAQRAEAPAVVPVVNKSLVIAHGVHESGRREILSIDATVRPPAPLTDGFADRAVGELAR